MLPFLLVLLHHFYLLQLRRRRLDLALPPWLVPKEGWKKDRMQNLVDDNAAVVLVGQRHETSLARPRRPAVAMKIPCCCCCLDCSLVVADKIGVLLRSLGAVLLQLQCHYY